MSNYEVTLDGLVTVSSSIIIEANSEDEALDLAERVALNRNFGVKATALTIDLESVEINADALEFTQMVAVYDIGDSDGRVWTRHQIEELIKEDVA